LHHSRIPRQERFLPLGRTESAFGFEIKTQISYVQECFSLACNVNREENQTIAANVLKLLAKPDRRNSAGCLNKVIAISV